MAKITSESAFEEHIEAVLLHQHGFFSAQQADYDKALCLRPETVISFIRATQTQQWAAYCELIGDKAQAARNLLKRIKEVVDKEGTLHALRKGFDVIGAGHFDLCYFEPTNPVAEESRRLYQENLLHVQRQLKFSESDEKSLDLSIFLNGLPIFTVELKNQISGQNISHAVKQYQDTRNPKEPLFRFKRCLAHFAVDNDLVYVTTELAGAKTQFLPFNQGAEGGAGNPPCQIDYATSYLWQEVWQKPRILDLIQRFIRVVDKLDDKGKKTDKQQQIFPRFHQLTCVRELCADARQHGAGRRYLNQHSAGSGKTNCIAWLANSLATLHTPDGRPVFSSVIVISDRRVIDRQLQRTLKQVIETPGMLVNIAADDGMTSKDLKRALEDGKRIIVTTLQKFGVIMDSMGALPGERFAVIVDEAHSSQAGQSAKAVQKVLSYASEDAQQDEEEKTVEDRILEELKHRGPQKNVSYFAFTATPKPETLQQFGSKQQDGTFKPFSLYTMRQAIEEKFILDVLKNYTTYDQYWALLKTVKDDPEFEQVKAKSLLKQFVSRHERTITKKVAIIVTHFQDDRDFIALTGRALPIGGGCPFENHRQPVQSAGGFHRRGEGCQRRRRIHRSQDEWLSRDGHGRSFRGGGFDQPKLVAMYVDKKLSGVACVQTLSRLNRTTAGKAETFVLDFENSAEDIETGFQPFYDRVTLSKETDPNQLYNIRTDLDKFAIHTPENVEAFAKLWFVDKPKLPLLHATVDPVVEQWQAEAEEEQVDYKSKARDFVKLYAFISHLVPLRDTGLEKLAVFLRFLLPKLPANKGELPLAVLGMVDMGKLALRKNDKKDLRLKRGETKVDPLNYGGGATLTEEEREALSKIIEDLNTRFNTSFTEDEIMVIKQLEKKIGEDEALQQQLKNGSRHAVEATFQQVAKDAFEDLVNDNFKFYKKVSEDDEVSKEFFTRLFEWYVEGHSKNP